MIHLQLLAIGVLADNTPRNTGPDFGKANPLGLLVIVLLLIGTALLIWSMNRQLRKLPASFDPEHPEPDQAADEGTVALDSEAAPHDGAGQSPPDPDGRGDTPTP